MQQTQQYSTRQNFSRPRKKEKNHGVRCDYNILQQFIGFYLNPHTLIHALLH